MIPNVQLFLTVIAVPTVSKGVRIPPNMWGYCQTDDHKDFSGHVSSFTSGLGPKHSRPEQVCQNKWLGICRSGKSQSPIMLSREDSVKIKINEPLQITSSHRPFFLESTLENNGHTLKLVPKHGAADYVRMSKVPYLERYCVN